MPSKPYVTDDGLILGYLLLAGPTPAEELVAHLRKKRTTLLPKLYGLKQERKVTQNRSQLDWRAKPYELTESGRIDVERYHLAPAVEAYLADIGLESFPKKGRLRTEARVGTPIPQKAPVSQSQIEILELIQKDRMIGKPFSSSDICKKLELNADEVNRALSSLRKFFGFNLKRQAGRWLIANNLQAHQIIDDIVRLRTEASPVQVLALKKPERTGVNTGG